MRRDKSSEKLIIQVQEGETVMVLSGEVPVLHVRTPEAFNPQDEVRYLGGWMSKLIMAMNFLRAGCPMVILYSDHLLRCDQRRDDHGFKRANVLLSRTLASFGDGEYSFRVDVRHGGGVINITREPLKD